MTSDESEIETAAALAGRVEQLEDILARMAEVMEGDDLPSDEEAFAIIGGLLREAGAL